MSNARNLANLKPNAAGIISASSIDVSTLPSGVPQVIKTAAYTLVASDNDKHIRITTGGVTVPSGVFSPGAALTIVNYSASAQTITQGAGVTLRLSSSTSTGSRTLAGYGAATILCVAPDEFLITGSGLI